MPFDVDADAALSPPAAASTQPPRGEGATSAGPAASTAVTDLADHRRRRDAHRAVGASLVTHGAALTPECVPPARLCDVCRAIVKLLSERGHVATVAVAAGRRELGR